jgi:hypothetical protein
MLRSECSDLRSQAGVNGGFPLRSGRSSLSSLEAIKAVRLLLDLVEVPVTQLH